MIAILHLTWIIPVTVLFGMFLMALMVASGNVDVRDARDEDIFFEKENNT